MKLFLLAFCVIFTTSLFAQDETESQQQCTLTFEEVYDEKVVQRSHLKVSFDETQACPHPDGLCPIDFTSDFSGKTQKLGQFFVSKFPNLEENTLAHPVLAGTLQPNDRPSASHYEIALLMIHGDKDSVVHTVSRSYFNKNSQRNKAIVETFIQPSAKQSQLARLTLLCQKN